MSGERELVIGRSLAMDSATHRYGFSRQIVNAGDIDAKTSTTNVINNDNGKINNNDSSKREKES